jgi:hypothetical protein
MSQNEKIYYDTHCIAREAKGQFFSSGNMEFFGSRVLETVYQGPGGVYFVTSEKKPHSDSPRRYTVRVYSPETRSVRTVGEFNTLTRYRAQKLAEDLSNGLYIEGAV